MEAHRDAVTPPERQTLLDDEWARMLEERPGLVACNEEDLLTKMLGKEYGQPSAAIWTWVSSKIGHMAQSGEIPAMATPTFGRIMGIVHGAYRGVRTVKGSVTVQAPFVYVHMLSTLVHLNNFVNAFSFGLITGVACGTVAQEDPAMARILNEAGAHIHYTKDASQKEAHVDIQNFIVSFILSILGPFLYTALLEVAITLAQPFNHEHGTFPVIKMIENLERDLVDGKRFSVTPFYWEAPRFQV